LGGPLNKNGSFFLEVDQRHINNGVVINAVTLNPTTLAIIDPFTQSSLPRLAASASVRESTIN
jgi:hypothetical protein